MRPSNILLTFLRAILLLIPTTLAYKLNWPNQLFIVGIIYFIIPIILAHKYSFKNQFIVISILISPFLLLYARMSFEFRSYATYPIWITAIVSCIAAIVFTRINNTKRIAKKKFAITYVLCCSLVAYFVFPNYLSNIHFPHPYVYERFEKIQFSSPINSNFELSDFKGKTIVLDFWSIGCLPCFEKFPQLENLHKYFAQRDTNVVVFAVNLPYPDQKDNQAESMISKYGYSFGKLYTKDANAWRKLNITAVPTILIIDKNYKIRYRGELILGWNNVFRNTIDVITKIQRTND